MSIDNEVARSERKESPYPWQVVSGLSLSIYALMGVAIYSFIVLAAALAEDLDWTATETGGVVSAMWLVAPLALFCAPLIRRVGPWRLVVIGIIAQAVSLVALVYTTEFWHLYAVRMLMGVGKVITMTSAPVIIARYFEDRFGTAMSVFYAAALGSGIIMSPLSDYFISMLDWRGASFALAGVVLASLPLTAALFFMGRRTFLSSEEGRALAKKDVDVDAVTHTAGSNWGGVVNTIGLGKLIFTGIAILGTGLASISLFSHEFGLLDEAGFQPSFGAEVFSVLSIASVVGALTVGWMLDRFRPVWGAAIVIVAMFAGLLLSLLLLQQPSALLAMSAAAALGFGLAAGELLWINLVRLNVPAGLFATVYGGWYFAIQVGYAGGGSLSGLSVDHFQGTGLIATMFLMYVPAAIMSITLARTARREAN